MTAQHSPGPWAYRPLKYDDWGMVRGADGYPVASASTCRSDDDEKNEHRRNKTDPSEANARLIAAAPELLEALEAIVATWDGPKYAHFMGQNIDLARAAIAKAKGEDT